MARKKDADEKQRQNEVDGEQELAVVAWRSQSDLHHLMSLGHRAAGNIEEANKLANAGNLARIVATRLEAGDGEAALEAQHKYKGWLDLAKQPPILKE